MRCACIDIGSNTTRVLVADVVDGVLREVGGEKAFTRIGTALRRTGALTPAVGALVADTVAAQAAYARAAGAKRIRVVATAAIRTADDAHVLLDVVDERAGLAVEVLDVEEEAALAFAGAVAAHPGPLPPAPVAVVDVGGGSSEIAVGTPAGGVQWSASVPVGSSSLADAHLRGDPPGPDEVGAVADAAAAAFAAVAPPSVDAALAVGGSATSMTRLAGAGIGPDTLARALGILCGAPRAQVAAAHGLEEERVRLLPAGLHLLGAASGRLGRPLSVTRGGLREGVCLALARR